MVIKIESYRGGTVVLCYIIIKSLSYAKRFLPFMVWYTVVLLTRLGNCLSSKKITYRD